MDISYRLNNSENELDLTVGMFNRLLEQGQLKYFFTDKTKENYLQ